MNEQLALLPTYLSAHLGLSLAALAAGVALSVPAGVFAARRPRLEALVLGLASVLQTVPSLALLAFMVPALAALGLTSIGYLPALLGLSLYSLLPILRNTVTGLAGLDPAVLEAARGVGLSPRQALFRVELPLALPVIIAGVRTAAVWTVGTATLSTPVGAASLGNYIFGGLQTRNYGTVLLGCVASAGLALLIDGLIRLLSAGLARRSRPLLGLAGAGFALLVGVGAAPAVQGLRAGGAPVVTIGTKTFTESYILAAVLAGQVQQQTGLKARALESLGSTVVFDALRDGQIDAYVDYSGTLWSAVLGLGEPRPDRAALLQQVGDALASRDGVVLVAPLGFENTYALAMRRADAEARGLKRLSDLARFAPELRMGGDYEIFQRPEWAAITATYGLSFAEQRSMDPSLLYEAAATGAVDVVSAFSTDGRIGAYDLVVLEDDRGAIPPYDAVILASARLAATQPQVVEALRALEGSINAETMRSLNRAVDEEGRTPGEAAARFLEGRERDPRDDRGGR